MPVDHEGLHVQKDAGVQSDQDNRGHTKPIQSFSQVMGASYAAIASADRNATLIVVTDRLKTTRAPSHLAAVNPCIAGRGMDVG